MNIHTNDKKIVDTLNKSTIVTSIIGSNMYNTNNENSDIDYLHIYATSDIELINPFKVNHQIQYKENGIDHNYVSLHSFINNICNGDSTINFEVIHTDEIKNSCLSFLYDNRMAFYSYTVLKSYIGMCRRDYKFYNKKDTIHNRIKKVKHLIRSNYFVNDIINKSELKLINPMMIENIKSLYNMSSAELDEVADFYNNENEKLRVFVNDNIHNFVRHINPDSQYMITKMLYYLCDSDEYKSKKSENSDGIVKLYLDSFENFVSY